MFVVNASLYQPQLVETLIHNGIQGFAGGMQLTFCLFQV